VETGAASKLARRLLMVWHKVQPIQRVIQMSSISRLFSIGIAILAVATVTLGSAGIRQAQGQAHVPIFAAVDMIGHG
jgi:hypothetical protein